MPRKSRSQRSHFVVALIAAVAVWPAWAEEIWQGFEGGDIIFQEAPGPEAEAFKRATGSRLTHVGIVRGTGGGPYVVEAALDGVYEIPIEEFVERGAGKRYAVYRFEGLLAGDWYHPAVLGAYDYLGYPPDPFYRLEPSEFYNSELIYVGFKTAGVELGKLQRIGDLNFDTPEGRTLLLSKWREHPDCKARKLSRAGCWSVIKDQQIITPASLARLSQLGRFGRKKASRINGREPKVSTTLRAAVGPVFDWAR